jgi:hypothetical protein
MLGFLRRLIDPARTSSNADSGSELAREELEDLSRFFPPNDVHSPEAWDAYWKAQLDHGIGLLMCELFCDDNFLLDAMQARSLTTVFCVGSGMSREPHALAAAGLDVTALDLSPFAMESVSRIKRRGSGRFFDERRLRDGGRVGFVAGDLMDPATCPGPYDVIVERKTLQLVAEEDRPRAVTAVVNRLSPHGILLTHCHDGRWKPPAMPRHVVEPLLAPAGVTKVPWGSVPPPDGRIALVFTSTG